MLRNLLVAVATVMLAAGGAHAQLDKDQQKCLNSINKRGAKVASTQGKENAKCVKDAGNGKLVGTVDDCLIADPKQKVDKAKTKVVGTANDRCQGPAAPSFGLTSATRVNDAAVEQEIALTEEVFGAPVDAGIIDDDKDGAKCQAGVQKAYEKYAATRVKEFLKCKKGGLKDETIVDAATLESDCVFAPDTKSKVAKARDKIEGAADKCAVPLATTFPGECSGSAGSSAALADCLATLSDCRMCTYINAADGLDAQCDLIDNGLLDGTCPGCGNGEIDADEECDDGPGNSNSTPDACREDCTLPTCGDGVTDPGFAEDCDDSGESATCNSDCTTSVCPDGKLNVTAGEVCDDGNLDPFNGIDDFCENNCTQPAQDAACPASSELTVFAGVRTTACASNTDCDVDGVPIGECDTGLGLCVTVTSLDAGFTGLGHGGDLNDLVVQSNKLYCPGPFDGMSPEPCGICEVQGVDPSTDSCRCSNDNQAICTETFGLDASNCGIGVACSADSDCKVCSVNTGIACSVTNDCPLGPGGGEICLNGNRQPTCSAGQCVGSCDCYFGPPLPLQSGGTPICSLVKFSEDVSGTGNVDTGEGSLSIRLRSVVFLGELFYAPCPYCDGDTTPSDGLRDGTCVFGDNSGDACDAQALNSTFPVPGGAPTSLDCFPSVGKNVSGQGIRIPIEQQTGTASLDSDIPCGLTVNPSLCPCGVCSADNNLVCTSNADCAAEAAGTCGKQQENVPTANNCNDDAGVCTDVGGGKGECASTLLTWCDGALRANGEPFAPCLNDAGCDNTDCGMGTGPNLCGDCTISQARKCFLPTIEATGAADPEAPVGAAVFCIPKTGGPAIDGSAGFPGPARSVTQTRAKTFCASDPGTEYIPGTGGCP